ncbi:Mss4-like protein [Apodospora peruviana]|uniref:Mss4-like protein n=1 Tax=Apodospora peruviana TaxID=516989 RepID=A0AAE0I4J7_9PEZI|nr:Mss4-like protein [Apodospora peruviana]
MAESGEGSTKTYRGNCHCGAFVFEVTVPEIKLAMVCNCSICLKKGYMWLYTSKEAVTIINDEGILTEYQFGDGKINHKFCSKCGTGVMGTMGEHIALNLRTFQNLDQWSLELNEYDGAKLGSPYEPPVFTGGEPSAVFENSKLYHGSCHCGAVKAAVKLDGPLDETYKAAEDAPLPAVVECNCSICMRGGFVWIYPNRDQVSIEGAENLQYYYFNRQLLGKAFCKTCGVYLINEMKPKTDEELAALPEVARKFRTAALKMRPFNIRALNNFDLQSVKLTRMVEGADRPAPYVNP